MIAVPRADRVVSGAREESAFAKLRSGAQGEVDAIAGLVLMRLLPAVVERDRMAFGTALTELQERVGAWFAPAQGGPYHPASAPIVRALRGDGAAGGGQSSWGPAVYAPKRARNRGAEIEVA